jgi:hypothetical protein
MKPITQRVIFETNFYMRALSQIAHKGLDTDELNQEIQQQIKANPLIGIIIQGTHGVRKFRHAMPGKGKRGSLRVIYYYYDDNLPIYMLDIFSKNESADLSPKEKGMFADFVKRLKKMRNL